MNALFMLTKDITSDVNTMSYINTIEHDILITDITCTEVAQFISKISAGCDKLHTLVAKKGVDGYIPDQYIFH